LYGTVGRVEVWTAFCSQQMQAITDHVDFQPEINNNRPLKKLSGHDLRKGPAIWPLRVIEYLERDVGVA